MPNLSVYLWDWAVAWLLAASPWALLLIVATPWSLALTRRAVWPASVAAAVTLWKRLQLLGWFLFKAPWPVLRGEDGWSKPTRSAVQTTRSRLRAKRNDLDLKAPTRPEWLSFATLREKTGALPPAIAFYVGLGGLLFIVLIVPMAINSITDVWNNFFAWLSGAAAAQNPPSGTDGLRDRALAERFALLALIAVASIPLVLYRAVLVARQTAVQEAGHVTDRIIKATELLGAMKQVSGPPATAGSASDEARAVQPSSEARWKPNVEVRLGAIHTLERVAQDSADRDHWPIMETFAAYIAQNHYELWKGYPDQTYDPPPPGPPAVVNGREQLTDAHRAWLQALDKPRDDVLTAIRAILRRGQKQRAQETRQRATFPWNEIPMHGADLRPALPKRGEGALPEWRRLEARRAQMQGVMLQWPDLRGADLQEAKLQWAELLWANLRGANLQWADLQGAELWRASLQGAGLRGANLRGAELWRANLQGADLRGANLQEAKLQEANARSVWPAGADKQLEPPIAQTDLRGSGLTQNQLDAMIGDSATLIPDDLHRPAHWDATHDGENPAPVTDPGESGETN